MTLHLVIGYKSYPLIYNLETLLKNFAQSGAKRPTTVLNTHLLEQKEKGDVVEPDEYVILFPTEGSRASNKNVVI